MFLRAGCYRHDVSNLPRETYTFILFLELKGVKTMDEKTKVKVRNLTSNRVILSAPELRLRRVWEKKNAVNIIPFEQLEEAIYMPGVESLFSNGTLGIMDKDNNDAKHPTMAMDIKKALGLEPDDVDEPQNIIILNDEQRQRYLTVMPVFEFREKIKELPSDQIMELAHYAIEHKIMDFDKSDIIKTYTGIDVISAIKLNRDAEMVEKEK